jgi:hypothetical protein
LPERPMTEDQWLVGTDPAPMLEFLHGRGSDRKLRLFAIACCLCSRQLVRNRDHRLALDLATHFADGQVTEPELAAAHRQANEFACSLYTGGSEREIHRWAEATAVANAVGVVTPDYPMAGFAADAVWMICRAARRSPEPRLAGLLRDVFGNPFRPVTLKPRWSAEVLGPACRVFEDWVFDPRWRSADAVDVARAIYEAQDFDRLPILGDALMDAGCNHEDILAHCRSDGPHVRGCWVVDLVLGKE